MAQRTERTFNLADLFEVVVDAARDRLALVAGDERRTYAELEARANGQSELRLIPPDAG